MRRIVTLWLWAAAMAVACGQSWEQVKHDRTYLWGEGWGTSVAEADKAALQDLISKISVVVEGETHQQEAEASDGASVTSSLSTFRSVVNTYSQATLTSTEKLIIENEPDAHVGRWIRRAELDRIFEGRRAKVRDFVGMAQRAEQAGAVAVGKMPDRRAYALLQGKRI